MSWIVAVFSQVWPNLLAEVLWVPVLWSWSRWHRHAMARHFAEHRAELAADRDAHKTLAPAGRHPGGSEIPPVRADSAGGAP